MNGSEKKIRRARPRVWKRMQEEGWEFVGVTGKGHFKIRHRNGVVVMAASPSDKPGEHRALSDMRRVDRSNEQ